MAARTCPGDRLLSLPARSGRAGCLGGWQGRRAATQHSTQRPAGGRRPRPNKDKSASVSLPSPSPMRVVESGVSVTAMPSANQAARVNVRVPTQMSPFCQPLSVMASRSGPCGRQWGGRCGESVLGRLSPTLGESTCHVDARSSHRHINNGSYEGEDGAKYGSHGVLGTLQAATAVTLESGNIEWSSEGVLLHFPGLDLHPCD